MLSYETCAQALPNAPPIPGPCGQTLYRVTPFCRNARSYRDVFNCETALVLGGGLCICQECPIYTDRSKYICIHSGDFRAELFLDRLVDLPVQNLRKLFKLMLLAEQENGAAIAALEARLLSAARGTELQQKRWVKIQALWNDTKHKMNIKVKE